MPPAIRRPRRSTSVRWIVAASTSLILPLAAAGQSAPANGAGSRPSNETAVVPGLAPFVDARPSELASVVERYRSDRSALGRRYGVEYSSAMYAPTWTKGCVEHRTEAMQEPVYVLPRMRCLRG